MWLHDLFFSGEHVANAVMVIAVASALGLALGQVKFGPVQLGVAGPLFAGIALGQVGFRINPELLGFAREFGLILFVYAVGIRVGPGFFVAFQKDGALLNSLAVATVVMGSALAVALHVVAGMPLEIVMGLLTGATTNTPSLAAAQQMLSALHAAPPQIATTGLCYAIGYPIGIIGILLTIGLLRVIFRVNAKEEAERFAISRMGEHLPIEQMNIEVRSESVTATPLSKLPPFHDVPIGVVVSRVMHEGRQHVAGPRDVLQLGDIVLCIGPRRQLEKVRDLFGVESSVRLNEIASPLTARDMLVSQRRVFGRRIGDLNIRDLYGVTITRLNRAGIELTASSAVKLQFGDYITCVGEDDRLRQVESLVGNEIGALNHTQVVAIFIGIALGVLLGSIPVHIPGVPAPVSLGLAGGPVIAAIVLARIGTIGPLRWNMPPDTIDTIREIGVSLFMASVGIYAGKGFLATVMNGEGLRWVLCSVLITVLPLCVIGFVARSIFKINFLTVCGMMTGAMTAFANELYPSQAQATAYAAVYPLTMCLRIIAPQIILGLLWLAGS